MARRNASTDRTLIDVSPASVPVGTSSGATSRDGNIAAWTVIAIRVANPKSPRARSPFAQVEASHLILLPDSENDVFRFDRIAPDVVGCLWPSSHTPHAFWRSPDHPRVSLTGR